ncbi:MAG: hypothetical protein AABY22_27335 [Nanoarchaeota archaeon]
MENKAIGDKLSPIFCEIENMLWEFEANKGIKPDYTIEAFRAGIKIFMSVLMDKIWELQSDEKIEFKDRINMVEKCGQDVRNLVKIYTNIDPHSLYKNIK